VNPTLLNHFPSLTDDQQRQFHSMEKFYAEWNSMINVISRKDFDNFHTNHLLHSLSVAKVISFKNKESVLDLGTGGGFPGIPLAVMFPDTKFVLLDSIAKKIRVVNEAVKFLGLKNVKAINARAEQYRGQHNFVVTRAVAGFPDIIRWTSKNINKRNPRNGIIALKGGDLTEELAGLPADPEIFNIADYFKESYFETKKIVWLRF
jgi:16S rRNA (guanine527-N7)-methyltransferase